jgi:hypothetical protein
VRGGKSKSPLSVRYVVVVTLCRLVDPVFIWLCPASFLVRDMCARVLCVRV